MAPNTSRIHSRYILTASPLSLMTISPCDLPQLFAALPFSVHTPLIYFFATAAILLMILLAGMLHIKERFWSPVIFVYEFPLGIGGSGLLDIATRVFFSSNLCFSVLFFSCFDRAWFHMQRLTNGVENASWYYGWRVPSGTRTLKGESSSPRETEVSWHLFGRKLETRAQGLRVVGLLFVFAALPPFWWWMVGGYGLSPFIFRL
jgi:hypothetical protein